MNKRRKIVTLVIGIIAALVILTGQVNYYTVQMDAMARQDVEKSNKSDEDGGQKAELRIFSNDAVSTAIHFNFHQVLHFITQIYSEVVEQVWVHIEERISPIVYFETLFQDIISPNAP